MLSSELMHLFLVSGEFSNHFHYSLPSLCSICFFSLCYHISSSLQAGNVGRLGQDRMVAPGYLVRFLAQPGFVITQICYHSKIQKEHFIKGGGGQAAKKNT